MALFSSKVERWMTGVVAAVLVVMLALLAWQFGQKFGFRLRGRVRPGVASGESSPMIEQPPAAQLTEMIASPLAGTGWTPVPDDPAGIVPPAQAQRWQCAKLVRDGWEHHNGFYNAPGPTETVRLAFLAELERVGFQRRQSEEDVPYIILVRGLEYATLALRNRDEDDTIVEVVVTHAKPAE